MGFQFRGTGGIKRGVVRIPCLHNPFHLETVERKKKKERDFCSLREDLSDTTENHSIGHWLEIGSISICCHEVKFGISFRRNFVYANRSLIVDYIYIYIVKFLLSEIECL